MIISMLCFFSSQGQSVKKAKSFSQQLTVATENDRYMLQGKDGYYTNGLIINYTRAHQSKRASILKQLDQYEIGQKIFTAYSRHIYTPSEIDRPITGYLYARFTQNNFLHNNQLFQWGASVGVIGKASLGEALQKEFHRLIHIKNKWSAWVWEYQLKSEGGINLHGSYARGLLQNKKSFFQITPVTQATLGTIFTNISQGLLLQTGKINLLSQSSYWNASIQDKKATAAINPELFFYYYPELTYQVYNATVQGGLFREDKGPITSPVEPFILRHQLGALFALGRYTVKLEANFVTKEASSQRYGQRYGGIYGSYRFH